MTRLHAFRLVAPEFWVDVRVRSIGERWIASADTPGGPTLGLGRDPMEALAQALEPFDGCIDELLATVPDELC